MYNSSYVAPTCEIVETQIYSYCSDEISGTNENQGYIVVDSVRDDMPD